MPKKKAKPKRVRLLCGCSSDFDSRRCVSLDLTADSPIWTTYKRLKATGLFEMENFCRVEMFERETIWLSEQFPLKAAGKRESRETEVLRDEIETAIQDEQQWFAVPEGLMPEEIPQEWHSEKVECETVIFRQRYIVFTSELKHADATLETAELKYEELAKYMQTLGVD